jgi:7,8-dihydropterin-6-yl-methyl-4-(beta-D-ribofuranosyl)aminobenzene 5'-phosphate synthase
MTPRGLGTNLEVMEVEPTIAAFAELDVERVVPGHCTGWRATHRLAQAFPDALVQPSVGTVLRF